MASYKSLDITFEFINPPVLENFHFVINVQKLKSLKKQYRFSNYDNNALKMKQMELTQLF